MPTASVFVPTQRPGVHKKIQELLLLRKSLPGDCTGGRGREASEPLWARLDANYGDTDRIGGSNSKQECGQGRALENLVQRKDGMTN